MTIRFYSSLDTGAPALSGSPIDRIRQILLACLVNGYGTKPAAGWVIGHQNALGFSLGNGDGFISFADSNGNSYTAKPLETITGTSGGHATGNNEQYSALHYNVGYVGANVHWYVIADDKTVIYYIGGNGTTADLPGVSAGANGSAHYFGRYLNGSGLGPTFCSLGGSANASPWIPRLSNSANTSYGSALRNPFTNLIDQGANPRYALACNGYRGWTIGTASKLILQRITPIRAAVMCFGAGLSGAIQDTSMVFAGLLRGVVGDPVLSGALLSEVLALFGQPNTWQQRVRPITLPNGKQWVPLYPHDSEGGYFVSLDPADWE